MCSADTEKSLESGAACYLSLLLFSPVCEVNVPIPCLFLLPNQSDKGNNIQIMPLSAVFIAFYFGTGYESQRHEKNISNIIMNIVNPLPGLGMISLWVFIKPFFFFFFPFLPLLFPREDPYLSNLPADI